MPRENPFIGARAFVAGESLYGRNKEVLELLDLLSAERIVLLYSPSGAGKTSLIQASLIPELEKNRFKVLKIIRVNQALPDDKLAKHASFNRYVYSVIHFLEEGRNPEERMSLDEIAGITLSEYFKRTKLLEKSENDKKSRVLIFDQFEEILTIDPTDRKQKEDFFRQLGDALSGFKCWALFAMREDFVGAIDPFEKYIPKRFSARLRLDLLTEAAARLAIINPAKEQQVEFLEDAAKKLINDLRMVRVQQPDGKMTSQLGLYIEPVQLQVVCYELWQKLPEDTSQITKKHVDTIGDVNEALANYYAGCVGRIAEETKEDERRIREWFNNALITEHGIRGQVLQTPEKTQGLDNTAIKLLIDAHIVRGERRRLSMWYELAHDRLIEPVLTNNAAWLQTNLNDFQRQAQLWNQEKRPERLLFNELIMSEEKEWVGQNQDKLNETEKDFWTACLDAQEEAKDERIKLRVLAERERKEKNRYRRLSYIAAAATCIAIIFLGTSVYLTIKAWDAEETIKGEKGEAVIARDKAVEAERTAIIEQKKAVELKRIADSLAEEQEKLAIKAEEARKETEQSLEEVKKQKARVEQVQQEAQKYYDLGESYYKATESVTQRDYKKAIGFYEDIGKQYKNNFEPSKALSTTSFIGDAYFRSGVQNGDKASKYKENNNRQEAIKSYGLALDDYKEALKKFHIFDSEYDEIKGSIANTYHELAETYKEIGDQCFASVDTTCSESELYETAAETYSKAGTEYADLSKKKEAVAEFFAAGRLLKENLPNSQKEAQYFENAIKVYDDDNSKLITLLKIGKLYTSSEDDGWLLGTDQIERNETKAFEYFKKASEISGKNSDPDKALLGILSIAEFQKKPIYKIEFYKKALEILDKAGREDEKALMIIDIGDAYLQASKSEEEEYERDVGRDAEKHIENAKKYKTDAENSYQQAIESYKDDYVGKAWALIEIGRTYASSEYEEEQKQAEDYFKRAKAVYQNKQDSVGEALTVLEICKSKNNLQSAEQCFNEALSVSPDKALIYFKIGELYESDLYSNTYLDKNAGREIALRNFDAASKAFEEANDQRGKSLTLVRIGSIKYRSDDPAGKEIAKVKYEEALKLQSDKGNKLGEAAVRVEIATEFLKLPTEREARKSEIFDYLSRAIEIYKTSPPEDIDDIDREARAFTGIIHNFYRDNELNNKVRDYLKQALAFYEYNLSKISYIADGPNGTFCIFVYEGEKISRSAFFKRVADINIKSVESIKDRRKKALKYEALGWIFGNKEQNQKSKLAYYNASRLYKEIGDTKNSSYAKDKANITIETYFNNEDDF